MFLLLFSHSHFSQKQKSSGILISLDLLFQLETDMRDSQEIKVRQDHSKRVEMTCQILEALGHKSGALPTPPCVSG